MPISIKYDLDQQTTFLKATGTVYPEELLGEFHSFFQSQMSDFRNCRAWLSDYSEADMSELKEADVKQIGAIQVNASKENKNLVVAIVASGDLTFGLARQSQAWADATGWTWSIFPSRSDAERWLIESTS